MAARSRISSLLLEWYRKGHRDLPWRATSDPYRILVSEIMLQQTRAQAVIPYYERFLARFPTFEALAAAREEDVLAMWAGLGYYSRARNLLRAARSMTEFPRDYDSIRELPGVGDYTAAAVASIAFGLPHAVLDGNVLRVIARVENDASDIANSSAKERIRAVAQEWLDPRHAGTFNQALMELGATVCLPRNPLCLVCPLAGHCQARAEGTATQLPVKLRRVEPVNIAGELLIIRRNGELLLRPSRVAGFQDLPTPEDVPRAKIGEPLGEIRHTITHHRFRFAVHRAELRARVRPPLQWWKEPIPLSTTARKALALEGKVYKLL